MATYKVHDPSKDVLIVGVAPLSGLSQGDYITIDEANDQMSWVPGVDGSGQFVENKDRSGTIVIRVKSHSPANTALSAIHKAKVPVPVIFRRNNSLTVFSTNAAMCIKRPAIVGSDSNGDVEWRFVYGTGEGFISGALEI